MTYQATRDVVQRVMPVINRLASQTIDRARLLQYLSARAGVAWGILSVVDDRSTIPAGGALASSPVRQVTFRDTLSGTESVLQYPECLRGVPSTIEPLLVAEYQRLATDRPLTTMAPELFGWLFQASHCDQCRWQGAEHAQIQRECHFAGHPVNFEPAITGA